MGIDNPVHLIFLAAVALIVLGPKRLPELARSLGHGMREFRESMSQSMDERDHSTAPLVPQQAQLVAAPAEPIPATPSDVVVVDPAAPERAATAGLSDTPVPPAALVPPAAPASTAVAEAVERPSSPPAA